MLKSLFKKSTPDSEDSKDDTYREAVFKYRHGTVKEYEPITILDDVVIKDFYSYIFHFPGGNAVPSGLLYFKYDGLDPKTIDMDDYNTFCRTLDDRDIIYKHGKRNKRRKTI